jgi:lysyl-tRNA synthetase class 2
MDRVFASLAGQARGVLAPSDLVALVESTPFDGAAVAVGGRVAAIGAIGDRGFVLADAFDKIAVELAVGDRPSAGELVVVEGHLRNGRLLESRLLARVMPVRPPAVEPRWSPNDDAPPPSETARLRSGIGVKLRARARALRAIRGYFDRERFVEVETPAMVPSPGLDLHLDAFEVRGAAEPRYLVTSPEYQMKRLLVAGVPRCFQVARCFRRGELGGSHNPEFTMLEWYRSFALVDSVMVDTERLVREVVGELTGQQEVTVRGVKVDLSQPFERITVGEAFERHAGVSADEALQLASTEEERFFRLLVDKVEPALARSPTGVFLVDFPAPFASLARLRPEDPRVCERFELYVGGLELCNGFGELTSAVEQRARLVRDRAARRAGGLPDYPIDGRFLAALEEGMPPAAGNALGVDRLVAVAVGATRIGDVMSFPEQWL